jgi:ubiquinone/menaquinone biosynthesis C-methylase UbiE
MSTASPFDTMSVEEIQAVAANLAHPKGELGAAVAEKMNESNIGLTCLMYDHLNVNENSRVLEIGFGNGRLLSELIAEVAHVSGIDISIDMIAAAKEIQWAAIESGKLDIQFGSTSSIPYASESFDAICTANTLYFWKDVPTDLAEIKRVLKPGGRLALGIRSRSKMVSMPFTAYGFTMYEPSEVEQLLRDHGFTNVGHIQVDEDQPLDCVVVWGEKA